jgi:predicted nucleotidyltransferase
MNRLFVLSPANCNGLRASYVLKKNSRSDLAKRLRGNGVPLGEIFSFLSALYFRGKLAYAEAFARPPTDWPGILIITPTAGLLPHDALVRLPKLRGFSRVPIHVKNQRYRSALQRTAKKLASETGSDCEVVLLGSIASGKYLDILVPIFGSRLRVPAEFIGRGDMSRGGLMLRCVRENRELNYIDAAVLSASGPKRRPARSKRVECQGATSIESLPL